MLPTLCREFSNWVSLVFEESWLWECPTSSANYSFYTRRMIHVQERSGGNGAILNKRFYLKSFVWYKTSQELSSTVIYFYQNFTGLWEFGLPVPSNSVKGRYVSNGDKGRLLKVLNCILATRYRSVGQHFTLSIHSIVFFMLKWKIQ